MVEPVLFATVEEFSTWLKENGKLENEIWLQLAKKISSQPTLNYRQALDVALCYGWIDGIKKSLSEQHFLQRFTPRKPSSPWSLINRNRAEILIQQGLMQDAGLAEITKAKANGMWERAYAGSATINVPQDFALALSKNVQAKTMFAQLNRQNRYAILYRLNAVKKAETRAKKIEQFVAMLAKGEKLHP